MVQPGPEGISCCDFKLLLKRIAVSFYLFAILP